MSRKFRFTTTVCFGPSDEPQCELDVTVGYSVAWGSAESGRFGPPEQYDPGAPDEVEDLEVLLVEGKPRPWNDPFNSDRELSERILAEVERIHDRLIQDAFEQLEAEAPDA